MPRMHLGLRFLSRRALLLRSGAALGLAACDVLDLPESKPVAPGETIDPITPNDEFYVTSCCGTPEVDASAWSLPFVAGGAVLATADLAYFEGLAARDKEHTLQCIGSGPRNQAISNAVWSGLPLREILEDLGVEVPASAVEIKITGADGYATSIPVSDLDTPIWLVWRMNGDPLPPEHGYPVRLLNPGRYGTKNPKWILAVEFVDVPFVGFWESFGWSNEATYRANGFIAAPGEQEELPAGAIRILGTAFAGSDPIARVEVSTDGGDTWADAEITYANGPDIWTLWAFDWTAEAGTYAVRVRVTTESGAMDSGDPDGSDNFAGYDGGMEVEVTIT